MTFETPCPECAGAGFYGGNGPIAERLCEHCNGIGVLVEESPINIRAVPRLDEIQTKQIFRSVFATMRRDEGRALFYQMEESRGRREMFGI